MRFVILSQSAAGLGLAVRLKTEGHDVSMWVREDDYSECGKGIIEPYESFQPGAIFVADVTGFGAMLDTLQFNGELTYGGSSIADRLEVDREFATEVMNACKIKTPASQRFTDFEDAIQFIDSLNDSADERLVFKPEGKLSGDVPSYVSNGHEDLKSHIEKCQTVFGQNPEFVLQQFIEGIDISTEGIFAVTDWVEGSFNHTIEKKSVLNNNLGSSAGCAGNVVWCCDEDDCPLCRELYKLTPFLRKHAYIGNIDLNAVVSEGEIYGLEFTPRFGYDATPTLIWTLFTGNFGEFLTDVARGSRTRFPHRTGYGAGVGISVPPWPHESESANSTGSILSTVRLANFYPYGVCFDSEANLKTASKSGSVGLALGYGSSINAAFDEAYAVANRITLSNKQYRTDLAGEILSHLHRLSRQLTEVKV